MNLNPDQKAAFHRQAHIVVLSGAGLSKDSGIPTFRDAQEGLWSQYDPEELASPAGFRKNPKLVMEWYEWRRQGVLNAQPNAGHQILARWESYFPNLTLITQNVDGLHHRAGSEKVIEMHGSIHRMKCIKQGHPSAWITAPESQRCHLCGSMLRPDIVWFGESIEKDNLTAIDRALRSCEIFLAIGTSGLVYPAAGFLMAAKAHGALTVTINPDPSARGNADVFLLGTACDALKKLSYDILDLRL